MKKSLCVFCVVYNLDSATQNPYRTVERKIPQFCYVKTTFLWITIQRGPSFIQNALFNFDILISSSAGRACWTNAIFSTQSKSGKCSVPQTTTSSSSLGSSSFHLSWSFIKMVTKGTFILAKSVFILSRHRKRGRSETSLIRRHFVPC